MLQSVGIEPIRNKGRDRRGSMQPTAVQRGRTYGALHERVASLRLHLHQMGISRELISATAKHRSIAQVVPQPLSAARGWHPGFELATALESAHGLAQVTFDIPEEAASVIDAIKRPLDVAHDGVDPSAHPLPRSRRGRRATRLDLMDTVQTNPWSGRIVV